MLFSCYFSFFLKRLNKLEKVLIVPFLSKIKHKISGITIKYTITPGTIQKKGQYFVCPAYAPKGTVFINDGVNQEKMIATPSVGP